MPAEPLISLGVLSSWYRIQQTQITNLIATTTPTLPPDPRRWAMIFSAGPAGDLRADNNAFTGGQRLITVPQNTLPLMWYFSQVGSILHGPWWAVVSAATTGLITEILLEPPAQIGG